MSFIEPPFWARNWRTIPSHAAIKVVEPATPPAEPLDVAELRAHLGQSLNDDDDLIGRYLSSARTYIENRIGRPLRLTDVDVYLDGGLAYAGVILLPIAPLNGVTQIATTDLANVETVVDASVYLVDTASDPARIAVRAGQVWPVNLRPFQAVRLRLSVGYTSVPEDLLQALRVLVAHYYDNRAGAPSDVMGEVDRLLAAYELVVVG